MTRRRKILAGALGFTLLVLLLPPGMFYWRAWRALPDYEGEIRVNGLSEPVRVLRDPAGVPHIYARTLDDLIFAQGYVHAQERLWQMDMLRRTARGRLAEVVGGAGLDSDKENRVLGLGAAADRAAEMLAGEKLHNLEMYARGVNAYIRERTGHPWTSGLPIEFALLRYRPELWRPADSIAVGLNMFKLLTNRWRSELARLHVEGKVGTELAADLFVTRSAYDHPIAVPLPGRRRRIFRPRPVVAWNCTHPPGEILRSAGLPPGLAGSLAANPAVSGASNNWVVAGEHTESGAALLANDTHLPHTLPSVWFINHLSGPDIDVSGFSLPGLPMVVIGHNRDIAWGFTNLRADVQDLFVERFDPENPSRYLTPQGWQPVRVRTERIVVREGEDVELEVLETRHGPVVHDDGEAKIALQWTGLDPELISLSFLQLNRAANWEEFKATFAGFGGPAQNVVYADREGHIGYHAVGRLPRRRGGRGHVPAPGSRADFDWDGYVPFEEMPHSFDPPGGILATANNRVVPAGYRIHITDNWADPSRVHRIFEVLNEAIESGRKLTPEDMLRLQGDIVSRPNRSVAEHLVAAAGTATSPTTLRSVALELLRGWDGNMEADAAAPLIADVTRRRVLEELLRPRLGDDWRSYNWAMAPVFLENVLRDRPARWLPPGQPDYDTFLLAVFDQALQDLLVRTRAPSPDRLHWGDQMQVRMPHPVGDHLPVLRHWFSVGGQAQSGGFHSVKATQRRYGPSERFIVDFSDLDANWKNVTLGQSGHFLSPHYKDHFPAWLEVRGLPSPFTPSAVEKDAQQTLTLVPR